MGQTSSRADADCRGHQSKPREQRRGVLVADGCPWEEGPWEGELDLGFERLLFEMSELDWVMR